MAENTYLKEANARRLALLESLTKQPRDFGSMGDGDLITMGSRQALLPEQMAQEMPVDQPPSQTTTVSRSPSVFDAVKRKLFGGPAPTESEVGAVSSGLVPPSLSYPTEEMSIPTPSDKMLRDEVARRYLEDKQFQKEGMPLFKRLLLGAAIGAKAGVESPYGGEGLGVGITAGLQGAKGVSDTAASIAKSKQEAAAEALSNLMKSESMKTESQWKREADTTKAAADILAQSDAIRPAMSQADKPGENEIEIQLHGKKFFATPKPEIAKFAAMMAASGKDTNELKKQMLSQYNESMKFALDKDTPTESRGAFVKAANRYARNLGALGVPVESFAEPTLEELSRPGFIPSFASAMTGASQGATLRAPGAADFEKMYSIPEGSLRNATAQDLAEASRLSGDAQRRYIQLLPSQIAKRNARKGR